MPGARKTSAICQTIMTDGNFESSWQMRNEETFGVGEMLTFAFEDEEPIKVIRYLGGNAKSSSKYTENYRPAEFTVTLYTGEGEFKETVTPIDRPDFQAFSIVGDIPVSKVVIEVTAVHDGTRYRDLCITEIEFYR